MFKKRCLILILVLISGCDSSRTYIATRYEKNNEIRLTITSNFDNIKTIEVRRKFKLPYELLLNDEYLSNFNSQLDNTYHYEDNFLIQEYCVPVNGKYSVSSTIAYLKEQKYVVK